MELFKPENQPTFSPHGQALANKLNDGSAVIGVAGLGYVGLPIALEFAKKGFQVRGVDVSKGKIEKLNRGENFIEDLLDEEIREVVEKGFLKSSTDYALMGECDVVFIAVPTPFNNNKDPDLSYIVSAGKACAEHIKKGQLFILKSTTFPGTTEEYLQPVLEKGGLKAGTDFFLSFSPERVDPGNKVWHTGNTPIVVGGTEPEGGYLASLCNSLIIDKVYTVTSPKVAELEKLLENIFRSVNIALVNELALLCERMEGINVWEVIEAAGTKPFGYMKFVPGPGIGGHCIPIDPYYLSWLARAFDFETRFITLSANVNESMPYHVANLVTREIAHQPVALAESRVLLIGVSFKKNVKDLRNSPAEAIIRRLWEKGITNIEYVDPWVPEYPVDGVTFKAVEIDAASLAEYHCTLVVTDHDEFDADFIVEHSKSVVDTRNMTHLVTKGREKIVLLGHTPRKEEAVSVK